MDHGRRLAVLPRGQGAELRLTLAEWQGRPYVSLRVWDVDDHGQLWPAKGKGCSIRIREVPDVIAALHQVEDLVDRTDRDPDVQPSARPTAQGQAPDDRPKYVDRGRRPGQHELDPAALGNAPYSETFDEFES